MAVAKEQHAIDSHAALIVETSIPAIVSGSADSMLIITRGRAPALMGGTTAQFAAKAVELWPSRHLVTPALPVPREIRI
jgi:hypothetical protein